MTFFSLILIDTNVHFPFWCRRANFPFNGSKLPLRLRLVHNKFLQLAVSICVPARSVAYVWFILLHSAAFELACPVQYRDIFTLNGNDALLFLQHSCPLHISPSFDQSVIDISVQFPFWCRIASGPFSQRNLRKWRRLVHDKICRTFLPTSKYVHEQSACWIRREACLIDTVSSDLCFRKSQSHFASQSTQVAIFVWSETYSILVPSKFSRFWFDPHSF